MDVTANIKTLLDLQVIRLVGKSELPGHPFLYGTTPLFLEHFGLANLQQLNELDPTLQRSNSKEKAAAYRKPVSQTELELAAKENEPVEEPKQEATSEPEEELEAEDPPKVVEEDDLFIDDTTDEFDDDDEDDEDEEDFEDEEEQTDEDEEP